METCFSTNSSFRLVETDFLSSGNNNFLFRALLKLLKFGGSNSCLWKLIFWLGELIFSHFSDNPSSESYFSSSGNIFLNESSNPYCGSSFQQAETSLKLVETHFWGGKTLFPLAERDFLFSENCFLFFRASFLQVKTVTETS